MLATEVFRGLAVRLAGMPGSWSLAVTCPSCTADTGTSAQFCPACGTVLPRVTGTGDPLVGKVVARKYSVEQLIGEGGMGRVYRARQLVLDKRVVLKVLHQELLSEFESLLRGAETALEAAELGARRLNDEELLLKPNGHSTPCARTGAHTDAGRSNFNTQAPVNRSPM